MKKVLNKSKQKDVATVSARKEKTVSKVKKLRITKDMNLGEVVNLYPESAEVLLDYGLHCVGCFANTFDTIEMGAKVHGMSDEEVKEMVERLNEVILFKE